MKIIDLGIKPYRDVWELQKNLVSKQLCESESQEPILLVEHPHVYTLGFHGDEGHLIANAKQLEEMGAELIRIERGGDITYHGPGQLVVYPIINLRRRNLGVKQYVEILETAVIKTLAEFGIKASCNDHEIGVWIDYDSPQARKICAIGIKVSRGVTMHGLALNVNTELSAFGNIIPCGIADKQVTSMANELQRHVAMESVKQLFSKFMVSLLDNHKSV